MSTEIDTDLRCTQEEAEYFPVATDNSFDKNMGFPLCAFCEWFIDQHSKENNKCGAVRGAIARGGTCKYFRPQGMKVREMTEENLQELRAWLTETNVRRWRAKTS